MSVITSYSYPYGRCRWFPWLPRWWWTRLYQPILPDIVLSNEQERLVLESQRKGMEETLIQIKNRLKELEEEE